MSESRPITKNHIRKHDNRISWIFRCWTAGILMLAPAVGHSVTPLLSADLSPDTAVTLGSTRLADEDVGIDDLSGSGVTIEDLGVLPVAAEVTGFHLLLNGDRLMAFATRTDLPGGVTAMPFDIVRFDGTTYSIEFDGTLEGVPAGARIDAVTQDYAAGELLMSFDIDLNLGATFFGDEDLVRFDGSVFTSEFDGSAAGIPRGIDLDGAHFFIESGNLGLSFDASGAVAGVAFDDEDVLEYDRIGQSWEMAFDASTRYAEWASIDVDAVNLVPEPSVILLLAAGVGFLSLAAARRDD